MARRRAAGARETAPPGESSRTRSTVARAVRDCGPVRLLAFEAGGLVCAIPAERVVEVREPPPLTRVPGAPPAAPGVMALRGDVHAVLDVAIRLGASPSPDAR